MIAKYGHELQEFNIYLKTIYKCAKSLFNKIDKDLYFNLNNEKLLYSIECRGLLNLVNLIHYNKKKLINFSKPFGFNIIKQIDDSMISVPDVCIGLYFPYHNIGDEIKINMCNITMSNDYEYLIKITDTNKVYLPNKDKKFLFLYWDANMSVSGHNSAPFYIISACFDTHFLDISRKFSPCYYQFNQHINLNLTYAEEASAEIIQKAWRNYRRRKTLNVWKSNIKEVNNEIKYMPDFGINYYKAMNDFNKYI